MTAWSTMVGLARSMTTLEGFYRIQGLDPHGADHPDYPDYLDLENERNVRVINLTKRWIKIRPGEDP